MLGRPDGTAAREHVLARPKTRRGPSLLPPEPLRLTRGTHVTERQAGERRKMTAQLAAGGFSGEGNDATVFTTSVCT